MADGETSVPAGRGVAQSNWGADEFLERALRVVPSIIYVFNQNTQSNEFTNRSIGASMGYSEQEIQDMGQDLMATILHPDDAPKVYEHFEKIKDLTDGEVLSLEYRTRHKDGSWVWLLSKDTVFDRTESGAVLRHIGAATDVTRQITAEDEALAKKRAAMAANKELASFAYSISHDMKSPSNTLCMLLEEIRTLHEDHLSPDVRELLGYARETVQRMMTRIDDVTRYTRLIGHEPDPIRVSLEATVRQVMANLSELSNSASAEFHLDKLPDVMGVETDLDDLFHCLLENALKFRSEDRKPVIKIGACPATKDGFVCISVADNGIGIPANQQDEVFGLFKKLHLDSEFPGTGLGLAICRRIALGHGGTVTVNSREGEGTVFSVTLPKA